jgi:hypothetical protein
MSERVFYKLSERVIYRLSESVIYTVSERIIYTGSELVIYKMSKIVILTLMDWSVNASLMFTPIVYFNAFLFICPSTFFLANKYKPTKDIVR